MARNKVYSFINIVGLSVGMSVAVLIGLWLQDELAYNRGFEHYHRVAEVIRQFNYNSIRISLPGSPYVLRNELLTKYSDDFKYVVRSTFNSDHKLVYNTRNYLKKGNFMDPEAAELLSLHMLRGRRAGLRQPSGIL
jgi:hypothetical protein